MSKNRDRRNQVSSRAVDLPGEEDDSVGDNEVRASSTSCDGLLDEGTQIIELKSGEKNRLHRAEMHLSFLIREITAIANEGVLIGTFRRACAECQVVFNDSNAALWKPLKSVSDVLEVVKKSSGL